MQSPKEQLESTTLDLLNNLAHNATIVVQLIPAHCGLSGNEEADNLAKRGSMLEQIDPPISYREAKTALKANFLKLWKESRPHPTDDVLPKLLRLQQTSLFRLRTGHCRLRVHANRMGKANTPECPCGAGMLTPEHILQDCPLYTELRNKHWPEGATLETKLWGNIENLTATATDTFITDTELEV